MWGVKRGCKKLFHEPSFWELKGKHTREFKGRCLARSDNSGPRGNGPLNKNSSAKCGALPLVREAPQTMQVLAIPPGNPSELDDRNLLLLDWKCREINLELV